MREAGLYDVVLVIVVLPLPPFLQMTYLTQSAYLVEMAELAKCKVAVVFLCRCDTCMHSTQEAQTQEDIQAF